MVDRKMLSSKSRCLVKSVNVTQKSEGIRNNDTDLEGADAYTIGPFTVPEDLSLNWLATGSHPLLVSFNLQPTSHFLKVGI